MNCDEAFDALTDSNARESDALRQHLQACPRCRQMREVLEPALSLFNATAGESMDAHGGESADAIRKQFLSVEAVQIAKQAALGLSSADTHRRRPRPVKSRWIALQAVGAGLAAIVAFAVFSGPGGFQGSRPTHGPTVPVQGSGACLWTQRQMSDGVGHDSHAVVASCVACHFDGSIR